VFSYDSVFGLTISNNMTRFSLVMSYVQTWVFGELGEVRIILKWILKSGCYYMDWLTLAEDRD
jgi:hypothetical protein